MEILLKGKLSGTSASFCFFRQMQVWKDGLSKVWALHVWITRQTKWRLWLFLFFPLLCHKSPLTTPSQRTYLSFKMSIRVMILCFGSGDEVLIISLTQWPKKHQPSLLRQKTIKFPQGWPNHYYAGCQQNKNLFYYILYFICICLFTKQSI